MIPTERIDRHILIVRGLRAQESPQLPRYFSAAARISRGRESNTSPIRLTS